MSIKLRHFQYAFMRSWYVGAVLAIVLLVVAVRDHRTVVDVAWGFSVALVGWLAYFGYWLWRTQKARADSPRPGDG